MRIRKSTANSSPSSSSLSSSPSSSYSFSSITNNSLASSTDSSSSTPSDSSKLVTKCQGLDLLVKAIHQVTAGSVVGVPYIQKRVITRRRRRRVLKFENLVIAQVFEKNSSLVKRQQRKRLKTVPSKFQDSVLMNPKPKSRRFQRSAKICEELGS